MEKNKLINLINDKQIKNNQLNDHILINGKKETNLWNIIKALLISFQQQEKAINRILDITDKKLDILRDKNIILGKKLNTLESQYNILLKTKSSKILDNFGKILKRHDNEIGELKKDNFIQKEIDELKKENFIQKNKQKK